MRKVKIRTELTKEEITDLFFQEMEMEKHSPWNIFSSYTSSRVGLHLYKTKKGLKGYYESGEKNRQGNLLTSKTWCRLTIKEEKNISIVQCGVLYNPYAILIFGFALFFLLQSIVTADWDSIWGGIFGVIISVIFLNDTFRKEDTIFQEVNRRLGEVSKVEL